MPFAVTIDLPCPNDVRHEQSPPLPVVALDACTSTSTGTASNSAAGAKTGSSASSPNVSASFSSCHCASILEVECACQSSPETGRATFFIVSAHRIRLAYERASDSSLPPSPTSSLVGIFVPSFLTDAILERRTGKDTHSNKQSSCPKQSCRCFRWLENSDRSRAEIGDDILTGIHSSLAGLTVKGIISTINDDASSTRDTLVCTDLVIIEVPYREDNDAITMLIDEIHGHPMERAYNSIIKILPLSQISFSTSGYLKEAPRRPALELPSCPVCLHRIDPQRLGWPRPKTHELCSQFCSSDVNACNNMRFLTPWPDRSYCRACRVIWEHWKPPSDGGIAASPLIEAERAGLGSRNTCCYKCGMNQTLWVCLTCGVAGCGRYSQAHAKEHNDETGHPFSLELVTQRIWDYSVGEGEFVHRGDFLDCSALRTRLGKGHIAVPPLEDPPRLLESSVPPRKDAEGFPHIEDLDFDNPNTSEVGSHSFSRGESFQQQCDTSPKKAIVVGEEYEALLQSALEDQAQHYEGEITGLIAALTAQRVDNEKLTDDEACEVEKLRKGIAELREEAGQLGKDLVDAQREEASLRASSQKLLREQAVSKSLLEKTKEEGRAEQEDGHAQVKELEQQVVDLTANIRMREQIKADEELSKAQIFGTSSVPPKNRSGKKGKKGKGRRAGKR